jgi:proteasome lid subunit RPN8/RPN11
MEIAIEEAKLVIPLSVQKHLRHLTIQGFPYEVCGVLHQHNIIHQYPNTFDGDRRHGFDMEVDVEDSSIIAIWHSHPSGPDGLSDNDLPCVQSLALHGLHYPWLVVTPKKVTAWVGLLS